MRINRYLTLLIASAAFIAPSSAGAQGGGRGVAVFHAGTTEIVNVEPENVPAIAGAPFTADATTEFTQVLQDGNRIEHRFTTSLARDGRGRTRSEQDVAMLGPLVVLQKGAKLTVGHSVTSSSAHERAAAVHRDYGPGRWRHLHIGRAAQGGAPQPVQVFDQIT